MKYLGFTALMVGVILVFGLPFTSVAGGNNSGLPKQVLDVRSADCPFDGNPSRSDIVGMHGNEFLRRGMW